MSLADTQFTYISRTDSRSLPRSVIVGDRPRSDRGSAAGLAVAARRTSSVKSPRGGGHVVGLSRDVAVRWSRRWYSVARLAREMAGQFPVLARVMRSDRCATAAADVNATLRLHDGQVSSASPSRSSSLRSQHDAAR